MPGPLARGLRPAEDAPGAPPSPWLPGPLARELSSPRTCLDPAQVGALRARTRGLRRRDGLHSSHGDGASSPLGQLFDHGCDAITSYFWVCLVMCVTRGVYFHDGLPMVLMMLCVFNGFYTAMMETYFLGGLNLPPFNGPNEGNLMVSCLGPITYIYGFLFF